jgi:hypothetical protein
VPLPLAVAKVLTSCEQLAFGRIDGHSDLRGFIVATSPLFGFFGDVSLHSFGGGSGKEGVTTRQSSIPYRRDHHDSEIVESL